VTNALVLAGGGVAGIAWELGVLQGIADEDPELAARLIAADVVIGTSAGSSVAAQVTSGTPLTDLYDAQLRAETTEIEVDIDVQDMFRRYAEAVDGVLDPASRRQRIGAMALATDTVDEPVRLAVIAARLPRPTWPDRRVLIPAVDAVSGSTVVFTRDSGVELVDAVAASSAVPGVWPPVTIGDRRFVDGGIRSGTNADLAVGASRILVIQPALADAPQVLGSLDEEIVALRPGETYVVWADEASVAAFGTNPLSPATRGPSARGGRAVGRAQAKLVADFWR
jgi:NTE family protein